MIFVFFCFLFCWLFVLFEIFPPLGGGTEHTENRVGKEVGEDMGRDRRGENMIRLYCMKNNFNKVLCYGSESQSRGQKLEFPNSCASLQ